MDDPRVPRGMIATNVRLPDGLHRRMAEAAQDSCRSLNGEIIWRLRQSIRDDGNREESAT
jgi:predicted HicB family RNase H-like nuclease